jgi:hypothetical protein
MNNVIGICGVAGSGKDTFLELLSKNLPNVKRFALADNLKAELNPFFKEMYGIDIFTCSREQKELLRPILVAHGKMKRIATNGRHWTEMLTEQIKFYQQGKKDSTIVVTDVRYDIYPNDEISWLKDEMQGTLVHIKRYTEQQNFTSGGYQRTYVEAPNEDERINDPKLQAKANYKIEWPTLTNNEGKPDLNGLNIYAEEFIKYLRR